MKKVYLTKISCDSWPHYLEDVTGCFFTGTSEAWGIIGAIGVRNYLRSSFTLLALTMTRG